MQNELLKLISEYLIPERILLVFIKKHFLQLSNHVTHMIKQI